MSEAYILKNQHDLFLDKHGEWVDQADTAVLYRTPHKDEAINIMVEHSVKNPDSRVRIVSCSLDQKGRLSLAEAGASPPVAVSLGAGPASVPDDEPASDADAAATPTASIDTPHEELFDSSSEIISQPEKEPVQ